MKVMTVVIFQDSEQNTEPEKQTKTCLLSVSVDFIAG